MKEQHPTPQRVEGFKIHNLKAFVPEATEDRWTSQATSDPASFSGAKLYGNVSYKGVW